MTSSFVDNSHITMPKRSRRTSPSPSTSSVDTDQSDATYSRSVDGKRRKFSASHWLKSDLEALGVFYDIDPLSMEDFYDLLKQKRKFDLHPAARPFINLTKKILTFSFSVNHIEKSRVGGLTPPLEETLLCEQLEKEQGDINECEEKFYDEFPEKCSKDELPKKLFKHWSTKLDDFLEDCKDMIQCLYHPELFNPSGSSSSTTMSKDRKKGEGIFREIFISWARVFFLRPKIGDRKQTNIFLKGKEVKCLPGVRFCAQSNMGKMDPIMIHLCEVKPQTVKVPDIDNEASIADRLSPDVLGQVGIELIIESCNSEFRPCVLGIICIQTELIFTFLDINADHTDAILRNESTEGKQAHIRYTRSFNFLKADDREHLTEIFFWLGCLQKHNLDRYYMKK